jgi:3-oxoacyl-[acyl-carrier-protein] synthase II
MRQSRLKVTADNADDVGVLVGIGIGGLNTFEENHSLFIDSRLKRIAPLFVPKLISNLAPGHISIRYGAPG